MKRKIFKPVVFFLDNATLAERLLIIRHIKPTLNGMDFDDVLSQPHLVVTNLSRNGERMDYYLVRCSRCNPHFYSRDCYKDAIVYGESDFIGDVYTVNTMDWLHVSTDGEILPAQVIDWGMSATEHMKIYEDFCRRAGNYYIGELE